MATKMKSTWKVCRRFGTSVGVFRSGWEQHPQPPGQHGAARKNKPSQYGEQLTETQKLRYYYGVSAKQFLKYYRNAARSKTQTNIALVQQLEVRLDNMVFRMGFAGTIAAARQMVVHRHIFVNGKPVDRPSYQLREGDVVQLRPKSQKVERYKEWYGFYWQDVKYIQRDESNFAATLLRIPDREEVPIIVSDQLVVEFMAR